MAYPLSTRFWPTASLGVSDKSEHGLPGAFPNYFGIILFGVAPHMLFQFDRFLLDSARFELKASGIPLEPQPQPQAMRLLLLLAERHGQLVTKHEIFDNLWDGRAVSDDALSSQIKALRKVMGDAMRPYSIIGTVHGKGYRLLPHVRRIADRSMLFAEQDEAQPVENSQIAKPPTIAVLPFRLIGSAGPHAQLTEALPDEIITALSQSRAMQVIARGSSFQFPSIMTDPDTIRTRLGAEYSLSGTVGIDGETIAVTVELADTRDTTIIWSEHYEFPLQGVHEIRQEIVAKTVTSIDFHMPQHEMSRTRLHVPEQLTAWEAYHMGISHIFTFGRPDYAAAENYLNRAIAIDPGFARAHAGLSHIHWWQMVQQASHIGPETRSKMLDSAYRAIDCDPLDPFANLVRGRASWLSQDMEQGLGWFHRAIQLCPSYSMAHVALANLYSLSDLADAALPHVEQAIDLSPVDPWLHNMYAVRAVAHIQRDEYSLAAEWAEKAMQMPHDSLIVAQTAMVAMHFAGRFEEAKRLARLIRNANPNADKAGTTRSLPIFSTQFLKRVDEAFAAYDLS